MTTIRAKRRVALVAGLGLVALAGCVPRPVLGPPSGFPSVPTTTTGGGGSTGTPAAPPAVTVLGPARATAAQVAAWFSGRQPQPHGAYAATVPVATLAQLFIDEGAAEGVRGDVALIQSVLETGWFRFGGAVPASNNNFAGIGATDSGGVPAAFVDARTGVRAQIQHLRAYGDATATTCAQPPLHRPCVDPRFGFVVPKGKAATWNQMGNGNWATSTTYATRILALYTEMLRYSGLSPS